MNWPLETEELKKYRQLRALIDPWVRLGEKTFPDGTRCIAHTPHRAPEAYLHQLFGPLDVDSIDIIEVDLGRPLHRSLKSFWQLHNGIGLFCMTVTVDGLRRSWRRGNIIEMAQQPFSIFDFNEGSRPPGAPEEIVFFGSCGDQGDVAGMSSDGSVRFYDRKTAAVRTIVHPGLFDFLLTEAQNASLWFDDQGRRFDRKDKLPC